MKMVMRMVSALALLLLVAAMPARAEWAGLDPNYEPTIDKIKRTGLLQVGCIPELPYASEDPATGKWIGFYPLMAADLAKELEVKWECVPVTWSNAVLALQTGKVDMIMTLSAFPKRAVAVAFAGPLYQQAFMLVTREGVTGETWEDFNKPEIRIAVQTGTSNEIVLDQEAPNATKIAIAPGTDPSLTVTSGRADAFMASLHSGTIASVKNPAIGNSIVPTPVASQAGFMAIRHEPDRRWGEFLDKWAYWNIANGNIRKWVKQGYLDSGVPEDKLPDLRKALF